MTLAQMQQTLQQQESDATLKIDLPQEISKSFLQYALSIILGQAIPDLRHG